MNLNEMEMKKYDYIHKARKNYGKTTVRLNWFENYKDEFYIKVREIFKKYKTALDVGCGKGNFYDYFTKIYGTKIKGIDLSESAVKSRPDLDLIVGNAADIKFSDNSFDIVYHLDGMEHIPVEWELQVLKEEVRVAKKFIIHQTHMGKSVEDDELISKGMTPLHINIKNIQKWEKFYEDNKNLGYEIYHISKLSNHASVILQKL